MHPSALRGQEVPPSEPSTRSRELHEYSMFFDPEWIRWNERTWGLVSRVDEYVPEGKKTSRLQVVTYRDPHGRLRQPPLSPYLPIFFESNAPEGSVRSQRHWLELSGQLATELASQRFRGNLNLAPGHGDARAFIWNGFIASTRYTYLGDMPLRPDVVEPAIRKRINKAVASGFRFEATATTEELADQLRLTGQRQGFSYGLTPSALADLASSLDGNSLRTHKVVDASGVVVSAGARLVSKDGVALDWVQGTSADALPNGAVQLMYQGAIADVASAGARAFDFGGANIPAVARAKSGWGIPLAPYVSLSKPGTRQALQTVRSVWMNTRRTRRRA